MNDTDYQSYSINGKIVNNTFVRLIIFRISVLLVEVDASLVAVINN